MAMRFTNAQIAQDVQNAYDYADMYGTLEGYTGTTGQDWSENGPFMQAVASKYGGDLNAAFIDNLKHYQTTPDKKKKSNPLGHALQGVVRVGKFLPGVGQVVGALNDASGGKLQGHEISKNQLITGLGYVAGGALGAGLGMKGSSSSVLKGAESGLRRGIQTAAGLHPDIRTGMGYLKGGGIPDQALSKAQVEAAKIAAGGAGSIIGGQIAAQNAANSAGSTVGKWAGDAAGMIPTGGSSGAGSGALAGIPTGVAGAGAGVVAGLEASDIAKAGLDKATGSEPGAGERKGNGGWSGGGSNGLETLLGAGAAMTLLKELMKKDDKPYQGPTAPTPPPVTPPIGGDNRPNYPTLLGLATNAYAQDDQRRRLEAANKLRGVA